MVLITIHYNLNPIIIQVLFNMIFKIAHNRNLPIQLFPLFLLFKLLIMYNYLQNLNAHF